MQAAVADCRRLSGRALTPRTAERRAREWVVTRMKLDTNAKLSLFETNIRILGGLLAAFDLSQDARLLDKARELADRLMPNFDLAATGALPTAPAPC